MWIYRNLGKFLGIIPLCAIWFRGLDLDSHSVWWNLSWVWWVYVEKWKIYHAREAACSLQQKPRTFLFCTFSVSFLFLLFNIWSYFFYSCVDLNILPPPKLVFMSLGYLHTWTLYIGLHTEHALTIQTHANKHQS